MMQYYKLLLLFLISFSNVFPQVGAIVPNGVDPLTGQQKFFKVGENSLFNVEAQSKIELREDWLSDIVVGNTGWGTFTSGASSNVLISRTYTDTNHFGIVELRTGINSFGRACITQGANLIKLGGGETIYETLLRIDNLSTSLQEYILWVGIGDNVTADLEANNGIYFEYDRTQNVNWRIVTANSGVREKNNSSVAVVSGSWIKLKMVLKSNNSKVEFYINGVKAGENTTQLPINQLASCFGRILKSVGTTSRSFYIDYMNFTTFLNTRR